MLSFTVGLSKRFTTKPSKSFWSALIAESHVTSEDAIWTVLVKDEARDCYAAALVRRLVRRQAACPQTFWYFLMIVGLVPTDS